MMHYLLKNVMIFKSVEIMIYFPLANSDLIILAVVCPDET